MSGVGGLIYFSRRRARTSVASALASLPKFLVIEPVSTVRLEMELDRPSCEIDVELQNPAAGRSFVVMIGHRGGPFVQRLRLSGRARIVFEPRSPGRYVLVLANPTKEPLVLRLKGRQTFDRLGADGGAPVRHRRARRTPARGSARPARRNVRVRRISSPRLTDPEA